MKKDAKEKMEITHLKQQIEEQNRVIQNLTRSHDEFDSSELDRVILKSIFDSWWQSGDFPAEHRVSERNRFITLYRLHEDEKLRRSEAEERQRIATENERQQKEAGSANASVSGAWHGAMASARRLRTPASP